MKALSLHQPWASMIADGRKTIETRTWHTHYRGELLIVSTKKPQVGGLPTGQALCVARLVDCRRMRLEDDVLAISAYQVGRYAWVLKDIRPVEPFEVKGRQRLFNVDDELVSFHLDCANCNGVSGSCNVDGLCVATGAVNVA